MVKLSEEELTGVRLQLAMQSVQQYDRRTVWLLMRHIEAQEIEINATNRAADRLHDKVIDYILFEERQIPFWRRVVRIFRKG